MRLARLTIFVAMLIASASAFSQSAPANPDQPISLEEREQRAQARIKTEFAESAESEAMARDPVRAAQAAAESSDFRLIAFQAGPFSYRSSFVGVDCSAPLATNMTLAILPGSYHGLSPQLRDLYTAALAYNLELLRHPDFPYSDMCVPTDSSMGLTKKNLLRNAPSETRVQGQSGRFWQRWSDSAAVSSAGQTRLSIAVRNNLPLPRVSPSQVDASDELGMTALAWAAARAPRPVVAELLARGADPWFGITCPIPGKPLGGYGLGGRYLVTIPVVVAIVHRRDDVLSDMIRASPRKDCLNHDQKRFLAMAIRGYAEVFGAEDFYRTMILDLLNQSSPLAIEGRDANEDDRTFEFAVGEAWDAGFGDLLRNRPLAEIRSSREFVSEMAAYGSYDDLTYWVERLGLERAEDLATILSSIRLFVPARAGERPAFDAKFNYAAGLSSRLSEAEKHEILKEVFFDHWPIVERENLEAARVMVWALRENGFDLSGTTFSERGGGKCSILMMALSYLRDECSHGGYSPAFASALLEGGVDPNEGSTSGGLMALDLVERRAENGPFPEQFTQVRERLIARGAKSAEVQAEQN